MWLPNKTSLKKKKSLYKSNFISLQIIIISTLAASEQVWFLFPVRCYFCKLLNACSNSQRGARSDFSSPFPHLNQHLWTVWLWGPFVFVPFVTLMWLLIPGTSPKSMKPEFCLWPCHLGDASGTIYKSAVAWVGPHELWQIIVWHKRRSVWVRALCQCLNKLFLVTVDALGKWCLGFYLLYFSDSLLLSVTPKLHVRCQ